LHYVAVRAAIHIAAVFGIYLSFAMLIPAAADLYYGNPDWQAFAFSALFLGGLSLAVMLATQGRPPPASARFGFLVVNLLWLTMAIAGAVPLMMSSLDISLADAVFESVSGITTTGGTVLSGLDNMAPGILLWRTLLQWMGGLGVIVLGLFVLPFLNVGGMTYVKIETTDISERTSARLSTHTLSILGVYSLLTLLCAVCYAAGGMGGFDAITHSFSTISTGGLSNYDSSFARYADQPMILWTGTVFMFIGALPFSILILIALRGRADALLSDPQIRVFASYVLAFVLVLMIYLRLTQDLSLFESLTHAAFNAVSIITTTGLTSDDYAQWGSFAIAIFFVATFLGGCSGSTSGGIKAYRFLILYKLFVNGLRRLIYPNTVLRVRYGDRPVDEEMQDAVVLFISAFFVLWAILTILLAATGLDLITATTGALANLTNVGPGLGDVIGPAGNYSAVPDAAKWILSFAMLLGRLEILAVLVILTPAFWRR
jgi:trk system potassium uptake protein TrkH